MKKKLAIRTDASVLIGSGHVMRCLTLAEEAKAHGYHVTFICRDLPGHPIKLIQDKGFAVEELVTLPHSCIPADTNPYTKWLGVSLIEDAAQTSKILQKIQPDFLIVDHYAIDYQWEERVRPYTKQLMVIDDLANRKHQCDILLDSNLYSQQAARYQELIPPDCIRLFGSDFVLLRKEFKLLRQEKVIHPVVKNALIFLGGADAENATAKVISACSALSQEITYTVIIGASNPHKIMLEALCQALPNFQCFHQVSDIEKYMLQADIAIGAGGSATWERCSLGLPTVLVNIGEQDKEFAKLFAELNAVHYIGDIRELSITFIADQFLKLINDVVARQQMSKIGFNLIDGLGAKRVVEKLSLHAVCSS